MSKNILITLLGLMISNTLYAEANPICDKALDAIPKYESSKKMFNELFNFYKKYNVCMDGGIAEGIAGLTVDVLNKDWTKLSELNNLIKKDIGFKKFVISNIAPNVTAQENEVGQIIAKANKNCPKGLKKLCLEIIDSCKKSFKSE